MRLGDRYAATRQSISDLFEANHRCYGYRRIHAALAKQQVRLSEKVVRRLIKQARLTVATMRRRRYSSYQGELDVAAENLISRDFAATAPNEKWLTDITEFQLAAGKV